MLKSSVKLTAMLTVHVSYSSSRLWSQSYVLLQYVKSTDLNNENKHCHSLSKCLTHTVIICVQIRFTLLEDQTSLATTVLEGKGEGKRGDMTQCMRRLVVLQVCYRADAER